MARRANAPAREHRGRGTGEQGALRTKLLKVECRWGLPKRALRGLLRNRRKREAFTYAPEGHAFAGRWAFAALAARFDRRGLLPRTITHDAGVPDGVLAPCFTFPADVQREAPSSLWTSASFQLAEQRFPILADFPSHHVQTALLHVSAWCTVASLQQLRPV